MKNLTWFFLVGCLISSCINEVSPEDQAKIDSLDKKLVTLETGFKNGELTVAEFQEAVSGIRSDLKSIESASAMDIALYGGVGGIAGRTTLHALQAAAPFIPGPWGGVLQGLMSLLLGGSAARAKKKD